MVSTLLDHLPVNLWERDVLMKMEAIITIQSVQNRLDKQCYIPGKSLGKIRHLEKSETAATDWCLKLGLGNGETN